MFQYNDYALTLSVFFSFCFSLVLVIYFGTHGEDNDGVGSGRIIFRGGFFLVLLAI